MSPHIGWLLIIAAGLLAQPSAAQPAEPGLRILVRGSLTTSADLATRPDAASPDDRSWTDTYHSMTGIGIELRYPLVRDDFFLSLSAEYHQRVLTQDRPYVFPSGLRLVPVGEGLRFIPVEAGVHALIPFGSDVFRMSMGAGVGVYRIERILRIAGQASASQAQPLEAGLVAAIGAEYRLSSLLALVGGLTFRDVDASCENRFPAGTVTAGGETAPLPSATLPSKITVNGLTLTLGVAVEIR